MEAIRAFPEQQPLLATFLLVGLRDAVVEVNIRGFNLGIGAVLFVVLAVGVLVSKAATPALPGSPGLMMFFTVSTFNTAGSSSPD